jgi:uncharacterized membrane protein
LSDAFQVLHSPAFGVILALGAGLCILFVVWLWTGWALYIATAGEWRPETYREFLGHTTWHSYWALLD